MMRDRRYGPVALAHQSIRRRLETGRVLCQCSKRFHIGSESPGPAGVEILMTETINKSPGLSPELFLS
jgi:hypothetical protein